MSLADEGTDEPERDTLAPRQPNEARRPCSNGLWRQFNLCRRNPPSCLERAHRRDGVLRIFICLTICNSCDLTIYVPFAVHQQDLFRQFVGTLTFEQCQVHGAGLVTLKEDLSDMEWAEYDWRQDVIFRDTWRALLPRAHSMSLRSDRNHSSVCCADILTRTYQIIM